MTLCEAARLVDMTEDRFRRTFKNILPKIGYKEKGKWHIDLMRFSREVGKPDITNMFNEELRDDISELEKLGWIYLTTPVNYWIVFLGPGGMKAGVNIFGASKFTMSWPGKTYDRRLPDEETWNKLMRGEDAIITKITRIIRRLMEMEDIDVQSNPER